MEAAEALQRGGPSTLFESARDAVRSRSRVFWIVSGLTALAAGLRFATLGVQAYHHDEIVTANRVLTGDFWHAMDAVGYSESAPPLSSMRPSLSRTARCRARDVVMSAPGRTVRWRKSKTSVEARPVAPT